MFSTAFVARPLSPTEARRPLIWKTKSDSAPAEKLAELDATVVGGAGGAIVVVVEAGGAVVVTGPGTIVVGTGAVMAVVVV